MSEQQKKPKTSKAHQRATNKYIAKSYDRIGLNVPKGCRAKIQEFAEKHGESVNNFINRLIIEAMQQEGEAYEWPPKNERE